MSIFSINHKKENKNIWACSKCTFENSTYEFNCKVCNADRFISHNKSLNNKADKVKNKIVISTSQSVQYKGRMHLELAQADQLVETSPNPFSSQLIEEKKSFKICSQCTFQNEMLSTFCQVCNYVFPKKENEALIQAEANKTLQFINKHTSAKICSKCGYYNKESLFFCERCKEALYHLQEQPQKICSECKFHNDVFSTYCQCCHRNLNKSHDQVYELWTCKKCGFKENTVILPDCQKCTQYLFPVSYYNYDGVKKTEMVLKTGIFGLGSHGVSTGNKFIHNFNIEFLNMLTFIAKGKDFLLHYCLYLEFPKDLCFMIIEYYLPGGIETFIEKNDTKFAVKCYISICDFPQNYINVTNQTLFQMLVTRNNDKTIVMGLYNKLTTLCQIYNIDVTCGSQLLLNCIKNNIVIKEKDVNVNGHIIGMSVGEGYKYWPLYQLFKCNYQIKDPTIHPDRYTKHLTNHYKRMFLFIVQHEIFDYSQLIHEDIKDLIIRYIVSEPDLCEVIYGVFKRNNINLFETVINEKKNIVLQYNFESQLMKQIFQSEKRDSLQFFIKCISTFKDLSSITKINFILSSFLIECLQSKFLTEGLEIILYGLKPKTKNMEMNYLIEKYIIKGIVKHDRIYEIILIFQKFGMIYKKPIPQFLEKYKLLNM